jgi:membrane protein YqaA with SNARE-associated domain
LTTTAPTAQRGPRWLHRAATFAIEATADRQWIRYLAGAAVLLLVLGLSVAVILNMRDLDPDDTTSVVLSYVGLALVSFTCCAVPIPGVAPILYAVVIYSGYALNPITVALVAGPAMALGEAVSYVLGMLGLRIAEKASDDDDTRPKPSGIRGFISGLASNVDEWMEKRGFITLLVLAAVPNPIVAFANITAGATGMPFPKFYAAVAIGKTIRSLVLAGIGVWLRSVI